MTSSTNATVAAEARRLKEVAASWPGTEIAEGCIKIAETLQYSLGLTTLSEYLVVCPGMTEESDREEAIQLAYQACGLTI